MNIPCVNRKISSRRNSSVKEIFQWQRTKPVVKIFHASTEPSLMPTSCFVFLLLSTIIVLSVHSVFVHRQACALTTVLEIISDFRFDEYIWLTGEWKKSRANFSVILYKVSFIIFVFASLRFSQWFPGLSRCPKSKSSCWPFSVPYISPTRKGRMAKWSKDLLFSA